MPGPFRPPAGTTQAPPIEGVTRSDWAIALLGRLGVPNSVNNEQSIVAWETQENGPQWNPLGSKQTIQGSRDAGGGIQIYPSLNAGLEATVQTLRNGRYTAILNALHNSMNPTATAAAIVASPWGTGPGVVTVAASYRASTQTWQSDGNKQLGSSSQLHGGSIVSGVLGAVTSPLSAMDSFFHAVTDTSNWERVAFIVAGLAAMGFGLFAILKSLGFSPPSIVPLPV
jgi:hypothetical protein